MNQGDTGRFEEYITLRQEILELHSFCRQILYWTVTLVIAGLGWYLAQPQPQNSTLAPVISGSLFAILLLTALLLSFLVYNRYLLLLFRAGSFIAVFWESRNPERGLIWHRFNRKAPGILKHRHKSLRGFVLHTAAIVYFALAIAVVVVSEFFGETGPLFLSWFKLGFWLFDMVAFSCSARVVRYYTQQYEEDWIKIKTAPELQDAIHNLYRDVSLPLSPP